METKNNLQIKKLIENLKFKSPIKTFLNTDYFNINHIKTNSILSNEKNALDDKKQYLYINQFKLIEKLFQILKDIFQQNKYIFEKLKKFLLINHSKRNTFLSFDLRKEIFLDNYKNNIKKEEYYTKCKISVNNNVKNKLFNKEKYTSKTHKNILFYNNSKRYQTNINSRKINDENKLDHIHFINNFNSNNYLDRTNPNFHKDNNIIRNNGISYINEKNKNSNNFSIYSKRTYFQNRNKNKEKNANLFQINNNVNKINNTPFIIKNNKSSKPITKIIKNNHKNINNIFLSENFEGYKIQTYNPSIKSNLYSNYIMNNNIITDKNIYSDLYKENYLASKNKTKNIINTNTNEINNRNFREIMINYSNNTHVSFDTLKKNLKKQFVNPPINKNTLYLIEGNDNDKNNDINKKKKNNKFITYNNIININDAKIIHKERDLLKDYENKTPRIQTYLISFKNNKSPIKNFYKDNLIYHRPKSTSKFRSNKNKTLNYDTIYNHNLYPKKIEFNNNDNKLILIN